MRTVADMAWRLRYPFYKSEPFSCIVILDQQAVADMREAADMLLALAAERDRYKAALETIAGSTQDRLQAIQAKNALDNIGPPTDVKGG